MSNNRVLTALKDYCIEGTLHGLRYIGSSSLSVGERFFWLLSFSMTVGASGWFIMNVYEKWQSNPVIMSYGPYDSKLSELPFPAITICSMNRAKRDVAQQVANQRYEESLAMNDNIYAEKNDSVYDWTPQRGYLDDEDGDEIIPRRSNGPGLKSGLTLILDAHVDNYYCSSTGSAGFKVLMSSPSETPRMRDYAHLLNPGVEMRVSIRPVITEAKESLRNVPVMKRRCYFEESPDEKYCVHRNVLCAQAVREELSKRDACQCLRSCYDIYYITTKSFGKLLPNSVRKQIHIPDGSSMESTTVVHFYFMKSSYSKLIKSELFAFTDIISNIGGLLGLFMGFSLMSIVEIIYFLSLRLWCSYNKEQTIKNSKKTFNKQDFYHQCMWSEESVDCKDLFTLTLADDGLCCFFNRLPSELIYRKEYNQWFSIDDSIYTPKFEKDRVYDWTPQRGYVDDKNADKIIPRRANGPGLKSGLTLILDATLNNFYCSSTGSAGFKVIITEATESLRNVPIFKRRCYFEGEKFLKYYRDGCQCLDSCYDISYTTTKSSGKLLPNSIRKRTDIPEGGTAESTTIVHFYFMKSSYSKLVKSELFAFTDIVREYCKISCSILDMQAVYTFLGNIGGLLGLFMGFSIMSIVEIIYFLSLRLWCSYHKERKIENIKKTFNNQDYSHIYWFVTDDSIVVQKDDEVYDWTPQRGYLNDKNADKIIPRRANGPGLKSGLTLILDATLDHFYCSSTGSAGFKVIITEATESLRNVPIFKRRCYFQGEKFLKYYSDGCQCLDSCYDISYTTTKSSGKLLPNSIRKKIDIPDNTSAESITVVHFFFMKSSYNKLIKSELFAFTDIVSNIGGLLGLFMGFSIMSIVEIIYFLSLRLWCSYHKERSIKNSKKTFNNQDHFHISIKS
nr:unnamed protein product [Callosobruchus chinensis]